MKRNAHLFFSAVGLAVATLLTLSLSLADFSTPALDANTTLHIQQHIREKQQQCYEIINKLQNSADIDTIEQEQPGDDIALFIFKDDRLLAWINDIAVDESALLKTDTTIRYCKLGDGWYLARKFRRNDFTLVSTIFIQSDYPYNNQHLKNTINPRLHIPSDINILPPNSTQGYMVYGLDETPLFKVASLKKELQYNINLLLRWISVLFLLACLFMLFHYFRNPRRLVLFIGLLIGLRLVIFFGGTFFTGNIRLFSPYVYADNRYINSLGSLLLDAAFVFMIAYMLYYWRRVWRTLFDRSSPGRQTGWKIAGIGLLLLLLATIHYIMYSLSVNSVITMDLQHPARLDFYSVIAYLVLAVFYAGFLLLLELYLLSCHPLGFRAWRRRVLVSVFLLLLPAYTVSTINHYSEQLEEYKTNIWANKIALQHDPLAEMLLRETCTRIASDHIIQAYATKPNAAELIAQHLGKYYLTGYLKRYEIKTDVTNNFTDNQRFIEKIRTEGDLINEQNGLYYLNNHNGRSTYLLVIRPPQAKENSRTVYVELNSKVSSNESGYPELLLQKEIMSVFVLPFNYSYGKYFNERLLRHDGNYDYPYHSLNEWQFDGRSKIIRHQDYTHYIYNIEGLRTVVISHQNNTFVGNAAAYSYLLLFFSFCFFALIYAAGWRLKWSWQRNTLQRRITLSMFSLLILSLLGVGISSIIYSVSQYKRYNGQWIEDHTWSAIASLDAHLNNLHPDEVQNLSGLYPELSHLAAGFLTDINIYNADGRLCVSSQPEIFSNRIQSPRMNSQAYNLLRKGNVPKFIHQEHIGSKEYISVYAPYYNRYGELVAYINLPNFINQQDSTREISTIVSAYANFYIILMIIALFMGVALSNRMTRPLEIIRRNLQQFNLTTKPEHIKYSAKDELGDLIKAYNDMITALDESAQQLAQNERESAWREMARQIAHEIKNPLTPMRLSLQHLIRMKKDNAPGWQERFEEVSSMLLEQIDTLAKTASEFSSFAKSNVSDSSIIDLNRILLEQQPLFDNYPNINFSLHSLEQTAHIKAHHEQISRVLMNILTNAVQAIDDKEDGIITMSMQAAGKYYCITIEDNGKGIDTATQSNLFTPNFTTKKSGSGLGLSICRNIVESYGGTITYSRSGLGGACFTICLPKAD